MFATENKAPAVLPTHFCSITGEAQLQELILCGEVRRALAYAKDFRRRELTEEELLALAKAYVPEIGQGILVAAAKISPDLVAQIRKMLQSKF